MGIVFTLIYIVMLAAIIASTYFIAPTHIQKEIMQRIQNV